MPRTAIAAALALFALPSSAWASIENEAEARAVERAADLKGPSSSPNAPAAGPETAGPPLPARRFERENPCLDGARATAWRVCLRSDQLGAAVAPDADWAYFGLVEPLTPPGGFN